jgi:serine-type D-Ala-D-Ala endopeptidase (penicillin-binding protein 7)
MIIKLFTQLVLVSTFFQFFPADAGELEQRALAVGEMQQEFDLLDAYTHVTNRLPMASNRGVAPVKLNAESMGVVTSALSAVVVDRSSKEVLFEKNIHEPRSIGSITKLMTAHVFLKTNPDLNAPATLVREDVRLGASQKLRVGETFTVRNLLEASLVGSDNTSTAALARLSGMSLGDFIAAMNEAAASMGMQETTFDDVTGLSSKNKSIVTDLAMMLDSILENPLIQEITQLPSVNITSTSGKEYAVHSTDDLLTSFVNQSPYNIVGAKTGFLPEAGYCLGTLFTHEDKGELIVVVLGSKSKTGRFQDVKALAVWAYDTFEWEI